MSSAADRVADRGLRAEQVAHEVVPALADEVRVPLRDQLVERRQPGAQVEQCMVGVGEISRSKSLLAAISASTSWSVSEGWTLSSSSPWTSSSFPFRLPAR